MKGDVRADSAPTASFWTAKWVRTTLILSMSAGLAVGLISLVIPKSYKAEGKILPSASPRGGSLINMAASSGLGDLFSEALGGREDPILTYPEILTSRSILEKVATSPYPRDTRDSTEDVIHALGLRGKPSRRHLDDGAKTLAKSFEVYANPRSGIVVVSAITADSVLSAYIVHRLLEELQVFNTTTRATRGRAAREFLDARLKDARAELASAEDVLASFRQTNVRFANAPYLQLQSARLEREVESRNEIYRLLAREYETARIEEQRDTPTFSVIDAPRPPVRKHGPRTLFNVLIAIVCVVAVRIILAQMPQAWTRPRSLQ